MNDVCAPVSMRHSAALPFSMMLYVVAPCGFFFFVKSSKVFMLCHCIFELCLFVFGVTFLIVMDSCRVLLFLVLRVESFIAVSPLSGNTVIAGLTTPSRLVSLPLVVELRLVFFSGGCNLLCCGYSV